MINKNTKKILIVFIIILFLLGVSVKATNDANLQDLIDGSETTETARDPEVRNEIAQEDNVVSNAVENNVISSSTDAKISNSSEISTYTPKSTVQPTQSYSTVATIPEANLSLNNILNVILIAVGVILILLAIAILIKK